MSTMLLEYMFRALAFLAGFSTQTFKNYYKILKVSPEASQDQIKSSFKVLAKQYHPDINQGKEQQFKNINQAYRILSNKDSKRQYDSLHFRQYQTHKNTERQSQEYHRQQENKFERDSDPRQQQILEEYRKIQEEYMYKYMKFKGQRQFIRNRHIYNQEQVLKQRKYHSAVHNRHYNAPRYSQKPEEKPQYNQKFDRSKDSLFGFMGEQAKGLWNAWLQLKKKK